MDLGGSVVERKKEVLQLWDSMGGNLYRDLLLLLLLITTHETQELAAEEERDRDSEPKKQKEREEDHLPHSLSPSTYLLAAEVRLAP